MLIDSHAHLTMPQFDTDREAVMQRARDAGLVYLITVGTDLADCEQAVALAESHEGIAAAVGIHPHDVVAATEAAYDRLKGFGARPRVVAIGEIGLDFYRNWSPRDEQRRHFRTQLQLAREVSLPVIVHDREAHEEVVAILQEEQAYHAEESFTAFPETGRWPGHAWIWGSISPFRARSPTKAESPFATLSAPFPQTGCL